MVLISGSNYVFKQLKLCMTDTFSGIQTLAFKDLFRLKSQHVYKLNRLLIFVYHELKVYIRTFQNILLNWSE